MKMILAPDSFKGTLSSLQVIKLIEKAAKPHFEDFEVIRIPIADGGEGTVEALMTRPGGEYRVVEVMGPLPDMRVKAQYGVISQKTAVIEMAQASGLPLLEPWQRNPLGTTTFGTGEIIKAALDDGIRNFIIGIGGSATNDGGTGLSQALGITFLGEDGKDMDFGGGNLSKIRRISFEGMDTRIRESKITVICDVSNPLTGEKGATTVYGPQKGASAEMLVLLENGMKNYAGVIEKQLGINVDNIPGAGAAGGLGAALVAFFGAELKPGIETILDFVGFDDLLMDVDLVVTGEGRIDEQTTFGKVPVGVAKRCQLKHVPVVVLAGIMGDNAKAVYPFGIDSIMTTVNRDMTLYEAMSRAEELLLDAADRMFRLIKTGMSMQENKSK